MVKSWDIWDFPNNFYVLLKKDTHNKFFNEMFNEYGGKRPYARLLGIQQGWMKHYWRRYFKKNGKRYVQYTPLWVFKWSCNTNHLKELIEKGIDKIRVRAGTPLNYNQLKLPIKECPELYRIVAHLIGDGFAGKRKVPYYANTCKELRQQFKKDIQIFGKIKTYERTPNTTPCVMFPKLISDILKYIFNIEFTRPTKLPKDIFNASKECKSAFLQALYDDEGTSINLALAMSNRKLVYQIKRLLKDINIKTTKIYNSTNKKMFILKINPKYYSSFKKEVNFLHPNKIKNLEFALKTIERNKIQRTRPLDWTRREIITKLQLKPRTSLEMANKLSLTIGGLYHHLKFLESEGIIKRGGYKNKIIWTIF